MKHPLQRMLVSSADNILSETPDYTVSDEGSTLVRLGAVTQLGQFCVSSPLTW